MSVERLCAGPAVPLIYQFMKEKHPSLEVVLEKDTKFGKAKKFDDIESKDIISLAINHNDPLCMKVVEKFTENYGTETGNLALKTLPYGGIYLIGGVTSGIQKYMKNDPKFIDAFTNKGRLVEFMRNFQVFIVDSSIEVGLLGAEEKARREMIKHSCGH
jgi:glucokinase|tara:strand:- start:102 stop:578 length:477 start_codon:yes stop_codon:yes gene_type:complete